MKLIPPTEVFLKRPRINSEPAPKAIPVMREPMIPLPIPGRATWLLWAVGGGTVAVLPLAVVLDDDLEGELLLCLGIYNKNNN